MSEQNIFCVKKNLNQKLHRLLCFYRLYFLLLERPDGELCVVIIYICILSLLIH